MGAGHGFFASRWSKARGSPPGLALLVDGTGKFKELGKRKEGASAQPPTFLIRQRSRGRLRPCAAGTRTGCAKRTKSLGARGVPPLQAQSHAPRTPLPDTEARQALRRQKVWQPAVAAFEVCPHCRPAGPGRCLIRVQPSRRHGGSSTWDIAQQLDHRVIHRFGGRVRKAAPNQPLAGFPSGGA